MTITERDFRGLDLNLLLVFHALFAERSVTRAGARLYLGQPAVSGALKRLRAATGDELFVRSARGMVPTARATELARTIVPMLEALDATLHRRQPFDPARSSRTFRIGLSDSLEVALMPALIEHLTGVAPEVRLIARAADSRTAAAVIESGEVELAVGVLAESGRSLQRLELFDWQFVCLFDRRHVKIRGAKISLDEYLRFPHVLTSFEGSLRGYIDERLAERERARRVIFSSPHFATSPLIVRQMPALCTVPTFIADTWCEALSLECSRLPFDVPSHRVEVGWSAPQSGDAGLRWLIDAIREVAARRFGPGARSKLQAKSRARPQTRS